MSTRPLFLLQTRMLARFQSLLAMAQFAPMLGSHNVLGAVAAASGAGAAILVAAGLTLLAPATLLSSRALRHLETAT